MTQSVEVPALTPLREVVRQHVAHVLDGCGWNKARAARVLGVDIKTVNKKIRDGGITPRGRVLEGSPAGTGTMADAHETAMEMVQ